MPKFVAVLYDTENAFLLDSPAGRPLLTYPLVMLSRTAACASIIVVTDNPIVARLVGSLAIANVRVVPKPGTEGGRIAAICIVVAAAGYAHDQVLLLLDPARVCLLPEDFEGAFHRLMTTAAENLVAEAYPAVPRSQDTLNKGRLLPSGVSFRLCTFGHLLSSPADSLPRLYSLVPARTLCYLPRDTDACTAISAILRTRHLMAFAAPPLRPIRLFLTDVDGTLTDSGMYYSERGDELKKFNTRDGKGLQLLRAAGIRVGIITGENRTLVQRRADKLGLDYCYLGIADKVAVVQQLIDELGLDWSEVAFIGDDVNDTALLERVGFSAVPADAVLRNREVADFVCARKGGEGCVREVAEQLLRHR